MIRGSGVRVGGGDWITTLNLPAPSLCDSLSSFPLVTGAADAGVPLSALYLQHGQECLLWNLDLADLLHAPLALLLFLEELALTGDVAAVALRGNVLAQGLDGLTGDHLGADRRLDHHLEHLAGDQLL